MNTLSYRIASLIKQANPQETSSIEVMQYALNIILNSLLIVTGSLFIGLLTGSLPTTAAALFSFGIIRFFSGGRHLTTAAACNIFSITLCASIPHLAFLIENHLWIINIICWIIMLIFAPNPDANANIPLHWYPWMKVIALLLVSANFFVHSAVIGLAFLVQSLTLIPMKRRD
ncbi:accessory gene regulator B family protein [Paenibacillus sp. PK3_47]|uniref:accessory gene regulator ArgB-like protein n=1 Tax=Paenibacillus sp. PK3_47 TaxID=2072642 RepID=UPI00201E1250|nr:accessory gene regulator B family protein [Paenibacillus sp. PK3_47]